MNRMIRSRLACLTIILMLGLGAVGCGPLCALFCLITQPQDFPICLIGLCLGAGFSSTSQDCAGNPDECAATFEQQQTAVIQFCEEYPEKCQQAFDAWVESLDTEAEDAVQIR